MPANPFPRMHKHNLQVTVQPVNRWRVVGTVCVGAFMAALDASIMNVALPTIQQVFHISMSNVAWVSLIYLLILAVVIVPFGRLSDMYGRKGVYTVGFSIFILGSVMCGFALDVWFLLMSRVIQAIGAGMLQANSVSIITANTPPGDRGKAIGFQASAQGIGLSIGPAIGGFILSTLNWRWIFLVNIPVGILGTLLGYLWLPKDQPVAQRQKFDYLGTLFLAPALVALLYLLNSAIQNGVQIQLIAACLMISSLAAALFIWTEKHSKNPLLDLALFRNRTFSTGNVGGVLSFAVMYSVIFLMPFFFERIEHFSAFKSGLYLSLIPFGMAISTPFAGMIADKLGFRLPSVTGMSMAMAGSFALALTGGLLSQFLLIGGLFLVGSGLGVYTPPNNASVMGCVKAESLGVAGGVLNMSRTLGMSLGVTLGGLFYSVFLLFQPEATNTTLNATKILQAFHHSFFAITILAVFPLVLALMKRK